MQLWLQANTQWRASGFGVIGLDYPAVERIARLMGIHWSYGMFRKIQTLERVTLKNMRSK